LCPLGWIYYLWLILPPMFALLVHKCTTSALVVGCVGFSGRSPLGGDANDLGGPKTQRTLRGPLRLFRFAGIAFVWPLICTRLFQPDPTLLHSDHTVGGFQAISTLLIGNVYFWGLSALWLGLAWEAFVRRKEPTLQAVPYLRPLHPDEYRVSAVMPVFS